MKKMLFAGIGICLLFIGLLGLALPILPGFVLIFMGFTILNKESGRFEKWNSLKDELFNKLKSYLHLVKI